ncbi:MAG: MmgE/PrpD family protein [Candidatus Tectomicrobia bacterium]|nr:MmgE/PrpD family protein [Candidatus Tectomicrobia bacterium]
MDLTERLVEHLVEVKYEDLPPEAVEGAKKMVLDTLGVALAGSSAPGSDALIGRIRAWSPAGRSTLLAHGGKVSAPLAAWANASMARARELDDSHDPTGDHPGVAAAPAAFAVAEEVGSVGGREVIAAVALGVDLVARLRMACEIPVGSIAWGAATFAPFSSAAVAGRLLGLDKGRMRDALGLAYSQLAGSLQCQLDGTLNLRVQHGMAVEAGVRAAFLARSGLDGVRNFLEGRFGLYATYFLGRWTPDVITRDLGRRFEVSGVSVKHYPCGRYFHGAVDSVLEIVKAQDLSPDRIREIRVKLSRNGYNMVCEPREHRLQPRTPFHAAFSLYYCLAAAAVRRRLFLGEIAEDAISDPAILSLAQRVRPEVDDRPAQGRQVIPPTPVEILTTDGRTFQRTTEHPKGHPANPFSLDEVFEKVKACAGFSARKIADGNLRKFKEAVAALEDVDDVSFLPALLSP